MARIKISYIPDGHHAEGDVTRGHVVGTFDFVDLVSLGHDDRMVLEDNGVGEHAGHGLRVAFAAVHRHVQFE